MFSFMIERFKIIKGSEFCHHSNIHVDLTIVSTVSDVLIIILSISK